MGLSHSHPSYTNCAGFFLEFSDLKDHGTQEIARKCLEFDASTQPSELLAKIQRSAGRIIFYLSSSNWPMVFQKIRQKLFKLGQGDIDAAGVVGSVGSTSERDSVDLTEIRLLEWCSLNRSRLGMVLAELCNTVKHFPKRVQLLTAVVLRRSIWNWIGSFSGEFEALMFSRKMMDGKEAG